MSNTDIRNDQQRYGREAAAREGTLHVARRPIDENRRGPRKPFVAKGHDKILAESQQHGQTLHIITMGGDRYNGTLVARDKFTITIKDKRTGSDVTFYKHGIESFSVIAKEDA